MHLRLLKKATVRLSNLLIVRIMLFLCSLLESEQLKNYYIDYYYGQKLGMEPTSGSQSNLTFGSGDRNLDAILKATKKGILVTGFIGGNSNPTTGDFSYGIVGFLIENGIVTQPINEIITDKMLYWLPDWYKVRDFEGYSKSIILITLIVNLILNGLLAPYLEELYFRGYLLPRMQTWRKYAPLMSAILFSFYHFWQPQIYLTLVIALFPMTYLVWKTKSLKLAIYTHCGLNIVGALLSFGMINQ